MRSNKKNPTLSATDLQIKQAIQELRGLKNKKDDFRTALTKALKLNDSAINPQKIFTNKIFQQKSISHLAIIKMDIEVLEILLKNNLFDFDEEVDKRTLIDLAIEQYENPKNPPSTPLPFSLSFSFLPFLRSEPKKNNAGKNLDPNAKKVLESILWHSNKTKHQREIAKLLSRDYALFEDEKGGLQKFDQYVIKIIKENNRGFFRLLLEAPSKYSAERRITDNDIIGTAIKNNDISQIKLLCTHPILKIEALIKAGIANKTGIIKLLINNIEDSKIPSLMDEACEENSVGFAEALIDRIDVISYDLIVKVITGKHFEIFDLLLKSGINIFYYNSKKDIEPKISNPKIKKLYDEIKGYCNELKEIIFNSEGTQKDKITKIDKLRKRISDEGYSDYEQAIFASFLNETIGKNSTYTNFIKVIYGENKYGPPSASSQPEVAKHLAQIGYFNSTKITFDTITILTLPHGALEIAKIIDNNNMLWNNRRKALIRSKVEPALKDIGMLDDLSGIILEYLTGYKHYKLKADGDDRISVLDEEKERKIGIAAEKSAAEQNPDKKSIDDKERPHQLQDQRLEPVEKPSGQHIAIDYKDKETREEEVQEKPPAKPSTAIRCQSLSLSPISGENNSINIGAKEMQ